MIRHEPRGSLKPYCVIPCLNTYYVRNRNGYAGSKTELILMA